MREVLDELERKAASATVVNETVNVGAQHTVTVTELDLTGRDVLTQRLKDTQVRAC